MPANFQLTPKGALEPARLSVIDDAMRAHFHAPSDEVHYYESWYDTIGLSLALGFAWAEIRERWPSKTNIIDWLEANYTVNAWLSRR